MNKFEIDPIHLEYGKTLSNKPWGIACYYASNCHTLKRHWFFGNRWVKTGEFEWMHLCNRWYKTKKAQLQGLEDLCKTYNRLRFVPFKNNYKVMPQDKIK